MNKKNITLIVIAIATLLTAVALATYAYFAGTVSITNKANLTATTEKNNMVFDTAGGSMLLNVTASNMQSAKAGNIAAQNSTTLTVNFQANTSYNMVCTYDIVYEWTSNAQNRYTTHSQGVTSNEFTIQATLASNSHVTEGTNSISSETDLSTAVGNQASAVVVSGAQIDGSGATTSTAVWTITSKFYNVNANQSSLANKSYAGRFKVTNVSCVAGTVTVANGPTAYWFGNCSGSACSYGNYAGATSATGPGTGHNVYIGQDSSKYYTCITYQGHEVCLSQPYTQYGLEGHSAGTSFTTAQQASANAAILQAFNDAGINITASSCRAYASFANCYAGHFNCYVGSNGRVGCGDDGALEGCDVSLGGTANCSLSGGGN